MADGGWYPDPDGAPDRLRWWDGHAWTSDTAAVGAPETSGPPVPPVVPTWRDRAWSVWEERIRPRGPRIVGVLAVVGVAVAAILALRGGLPAGGPGTASAPAPSSSATPDPRPPLARLCASTNPARPAPSPKRLPVPAGPRITDPTAHISYAAQGKPFRRWNQGVWGADGTLGERFATGQYFVTQQHTPDGQYFATVLSGTVPATYGDDPHPNVECAARVIADDVRSRFYPQPNTRTAIANRSITVDGRPAYLVTFHLGFNVRGYDAKGELVAICVVDVPGPDAAALYVSIPDTHKQYDDVVTTAVASLRVTR